MNIPQGYKQTELGIIPEDWEVKTIASLGNIVGGGTPSTIIPAYWDGGIQWFTPAEIGASKYISKSERSISKLGLQSSAARILPKDAILLTTRASIGLSAILLNEATTNQGFQSIIVNTNHCNEYAYYALKTKVSEMLTLASGSTFAEISKAKLASIKLPIPPIAEQRAIAEALSDVDGLIAALDKKIAKKRLLKQGAMQQLLTGKKRLPGFTDVWVEKKLGNVGSLLNGYAFKSETYSQAGKYKVITIANVQNGRLDTNDCNKVSTIPSDIQKHQILKEGNILISMTGNVGRACLVTTIDCLLNQRVGLFAIRDNSQCDESFIYTIINSKEFETAMIDSGQGAAQSNIGKNDIEGYTFLLPNDTKEQRAIATILSDMDKEIADLEAQRDKYRLLKSGMMQKLLTGQIRLKTE